MARALQRPPPTSSIARLLDTDAAARAIATTPEPAAKAVAAQTGPLGSATPADRRSPSATVKREVILTATTDETMTRLVELYRRATGTRLSTSHVVRGMLRAIAHGMDPIQREARRIGPCRLPANAPGREAERERFEQRLAQALINGMRAAAAFETDDG